ncbi:MAG: hypothetical protein JXR37_01710 [Kiritimatiellae bacterium]|nr:hypothetical protein [Kiritimatiellia bacterium]
MMTYRRFGWKVLRWAVPFTGILFCLEAGAADSSLLNGLVGYWPFDEGGGEVAANVMCPQGDVMGCTGKGRVSAKAEWVDGRFGKALGSAAAEIERLDTLLCDHDITIAAWIKPLRQGGRWLFVNREYRLCVNQGSKNHVRFQLNVEGNWAFNWIVSKTALENGKWYHVAGVYDGRERRIYINGRLDASEPQTGTLAVGNKDFHLSAGSGCLDEVRIWRRALSAEEVRASMNLGRSGVTALMRPEHALLFYPVKLVASAGAADTVSVTLFNQSTRPFAAALPFRISTVEGASVHEQHDVVRVEARQKQDVRLSVRLAKPGPYTLTVGPDAAPYFRTELYALQSVPRPAAGELKTRPVVSIDLSRDVGPDVLCDDGTSRLVPSEIGAYREAGEKKFSRFAVRTKLNRPGLHLLRVTYPDDKPRICDVIVRSPVSHDSYSVQTGYFTGMQYPLSKTFHTLECVNWVRDVNQSVVFMTWQDGQPAAASRVEVFEVDGPLPAGPASRLASRRRIGQYWEDAGPLWECFGGTTVDLAGFDRMMLNLCDYMDYTGQNVFYHPAVWYSGPIYTSQVEPVSGVGGCYLPRSGFMDIWLRRFEERGFTFYPVLNVHRLSSLERLPADMAAIAAGEPTARAITNKNRPGRSWHGHSPAYNALHPIVQKPITALVDELASRYGLSPAFGGVTLHLTRCQLLWTSDLDTSYDDWTLSQFSGETGIRVPVEPKDPARFAKRYEWLMANAKERWIDWRCGRMADYYGELAGRLRRRRSDLNLVVSVWSPFPSSMARRWQGGARLTDLIKEHGIDLDRFKRYPGLMVQRYMAPTDYRLFAAHKGWPEPKARLGRDLEFDEPQMRELRTTDEFGVFFLNRYFESAIGKQKPIQCNWFKDPIWRASAIVPAHDHFMEYYAHAMALYDPEDITVGGFTTGTVGHEQQVERFARVFRQLPAGHWQEVPNVGDNVVARTRRENGTQYLYVVNRSPDAVRVSVPAAAVPSGSRPIGGSPALSIANGSAAVALGPYELAAWSSEAQTGITRR